MTTVSLHGYGVYCYTCVEVHETTSVCDHGLDSKAGVQKGRDGYVAQPDHMGHHGPHFYIDVDGMEMCAECEQVKIPDEMAENPVPEPDEEEEVSA